MWRLFPRSWFSARNPKARAQAAVADALQTHWRGWLEHALSRVLKQPVAAADVAAMLRCIDARHFVALDQALRYRAWDMGLGRPTRGMVHLRSLDSDDADSDAFLFTAACEGNGFIREQALVAFAHWPGRLATAIALIRCDDWVAEIREAARHLLVQSIRSSTGAGLFEHLALLVALRARKRFSDEIWPELVEPALLAPQNAEARWNATREGPGTARLFAYSLLARADPSRLADACREALGESDPSLAGWALKTATHDLPADKVGDLARCALRHANGSVRAAALRLLASTDSGNLRPAVEDALFDRSRSVRNAAAYLLRSKFQDDPADRWRAAFAGDDAPRTCIAVEALADVAQPDDIDRLLPWVRHRKGKIRAAALRALDRAKYAGIAGLATTALGDITTTVVREAVAILRREPGAFNKHVLSTARASAANERVDLLLVHSAQLLGKWDVLETYLAWYAASAPGRNHVLDAQLDAWRRSTSSRFAPLGEASKARIEQSLAALIAARPAKRWDDLAHLVAHA